MLKADRVEKHFKAGKQAIPAVRETTLELRSGEFCALVGESGCGKSTLAKLLAGVLPPDRGDVLLDGRSIVPPARKKDKRLCGDIQLVLQDAASAIDPRFTAYQTVAEPMRNLLSLRRREERARVYELLEQTGLDPGIADRRAQSLSGGQQKRVCIARALATRPRCLIFDEAVSGLDVLVEVRILDLIKSLHRQTGACCLMITHDMDVALYMASRVLVMKDGAIVEDKPWAGDPSCFAHPYTRLLLDQMEPFAKAERSIAFEYEPV